MASERGLVAARASARSLGRSVVLRALLRHRWPLLLVATVGAALLAVHTGGPSIDGPYFSLAGRRLLSGDGLHVYAAQGLQAGPWQIGGFGALSYLTGWLHLSDDATYAVLSSLFSTVAIVGGVRLLRRHVGLAASPLAELAAGVLALGWELSTQTYSSGHPAELVIPLTWLAAAALAERDRVVLAGILIGLGAGFETWGVLGVAVLLLAPSWRGVIKGTAALIGVTAATYLPFVAVGPFRMGKAVWPVSDRSLIHALDPHLATFPWSARLGQSVIIVLIGAVVWWRLKDTSTSRHAVWLIPASLALVKALSEPSGYDWYWLPVQLTVLAACVCVDAMSRRVVVTVAAVEVIAVTSPLHAWPIALAGLIALLSAAIPDRHPVMTAMVAAPEPVGSSR